MNDQQVCIRVSARPGNREAELCLKAFKVWAADQKAASVLRTGSMGYDDLEPLVLVEKRDAPTVWYTVMTAEKADRLIAGWLNGDDPAAELALGVSGDTSFRGIPPLARLPLFRLQKRVLLRRCGLVDPLHMGGRAGIEGYAGLHKALKLQRDEVLDILGQAGLQERDVLGYIAYPLWEAFREINDDAKIVVANALNNDIEAHMARLLMESDPHGVLEGLLIAAHAMGAKKAVIAIPAGTGDIRSILNNALDLTRKRLEMCDTVLEVGFSCDIEIREVPISLVINDKTALLRCLEGLQAIPTVTAKDGDTLGKTPALVTGIDTLASIPPILEMSRDSPPEGGTVILTLAGDLPHPYTVEVPLGTTLRELVRDIGGSNDTKAVQFGGPTSVWSAPGFLDKTVSGETASEAGAAFGLALLNVASNATDMVERMESLMRFLHSESCGKCVFCREGTLHLHQMLAELLRGTGDADTLPLMWELGVKMRSNCICTFGRTAANPVLGSLELFREEFERCIKQQT